MDNPKWKKPVVVACLSWKPGVNHIKREILTLPEMKEIPDELVDVFMDLCNSAAREADAILYRLQSKDDEDEV